MVRQWAGYCGAAVVLSSACLGLLSNSAWLLALWAVGLLTAAVAAAYFTALFIMAVMNDDFSCLGPQPLQYCCSSLFKKIMCSFTKLVSTRVGPWSEAKPVASSCTAAEQPSSLLQVTKASTEQLLLSDDGVIRSELIDLSQRLHDQFVLPWYLCLSPDGLSHHQLCGVLEDVLLSCWQQLRVAGGLRSLLLDCCELFSVLALAHHPRHHPSSHQKLVIGELGPREYDQLSTLSQLVVLRHLPPLLLSCKGLVVLLRDLLTCNFVVPLYLKLCQPCLLLQHWAAVSASSGVHGGADSSNDSFEASEMQPSSLQGPRPGDQEVSSSEGMQKLEERMSVKAVGRGQSSTVSLHQKRTASSSRSKISLASSVSQRKMLRKLLKHPNPIKIKTMFAKGVVDGMTEEDYKTCYFFNDLPRFIAPLNFHRSTYNWTHSSHKSEPSTPVYVSKAKYLVSRSLPCSPAHFVSRTAVQSAPSLRISLSNSSLESKRNSCVPKEARMAKIAKLNDSDIRMFNETLTLVQDGARCKLSSDFSDVDLVFDRNKSKEIENGPSTTTEQPNQSAGSRREVIPCVHRKGQTERKCKVNGTELCESVHVEHREGKGPAGNGSLKTKSFEGYISSVSHPQELLTGTTGKSVEDKMLKKACEECRGRETSFAAFTAPHSQLLLKKKKLVKMHSFDHFDGNIDTTLSADLYTPCQAQCSHCTHAQGVLSLPHRLPCCLRTCRYRSGSCGEVPRHCDIAGCELHISNDKTSDDKLVVSSARHLVVAPTLNEPPAQILVSSVSSSNEHPSSLSLLRRPQGENTIMPPSVTESLSAQPTLRTGSDIPANYGSQTCLPSEKISRSCLEFNSAALNVSESAKIETRVTDASIKRYVTGESGPDQVSQVHSAQLKKNSRDSASYQAKQNGVALDRDENFEADSRELSYINKTKTEMEGPNHKKSALEGHGTSTEKRFSVLEHWMDSVFESDGKVVETCGATSKPSAIGTPVSTCCSVDATVKIAVSDSEKDLSDATQSFAKDVTTVEVSAASAQPSPDDTEELSPVYEEANNLESSIAKLRSLLSERHPHQSGGSGSSVGSSDSDLPPDSFSEVSPSRHASSRSTSARFSDAVSHLSDRPPTAGSFTEPLVLGEQLPRRAVEEVVEVLEGRDVPRDGRLIVNCSIPATVIESEPCGSPYTLYTVQYDALYLFDGSFGPKKRKIAEDDTASQKKVLPSSESSRISSADEESTTKKSSVPTSASRIKHADDKKEPCAPIARGSSSSSDGKGESTSKDEGESPDTSKPRPKSSTGKSTGQKHRLVLHTKSVQRRFREFVSLHNALWVHPKLRFSLRGVTGPSKWRHLPHGKLDSATVSMRRLFLENYLQILLQRIDINTSSIMRQFLCYDSDSKPGEYRTPFEIDWVQRPGSFLTREESSSAICDAASFDQLYTKHREDRSLPDRGVAEQGDSRPKETMSSEQRPTSLFCQDSSSTITSLSSFRESPHVPGGTNDLDEMNLVNVLDIDNCELNIALTAELQPCAMEEALFEGFTVSDAGFSPDVQEASSDHHTVAPEIAHDLTGQTTLPVSPFLVPSLDQGSGNIYQDKNSLLVVSEPHCSAENTALIHAFHLSDLGNCVADSLSHALRLPLPYPDVGLLRRSVNTIKDCTLSTFSSSVPPTSASPTCAGEPLPAVGREVAGGEAAIIGDKQNLSLQTSLVLTSEKKSSVNAETISLHDFPVDDSVPVVTQRRASVEGIGDADRKVFKSSAGIWSSYPNSCAISSDLQLQNTELDGTKYLKCQTPLMNSPPRQKENTESEGSVHRRSNANSRTPEESLTLQATSCSPSSSTVMPENSLKRPASTFLNILNGINSVERPYADCIGVKYYCPNSSSRVGSCTRCEGSAIPGVTLPLLTSDLGDKYLSDSIDSKSDASHGNCSGKIVFNAVVALLNAQQAPNGKASSYFLTEPVVELMVRWFLPSITAMIDDKLNQLFSEENVANFIREILNSNNLDFEAKSSKNYTSESDKFSPLLDYERFLAALGSSKLECNQLDVDTLKEFLISSLPNAVVELGLGEQLTESVLLLLQDPQFSADFALETINLLCCHLLPQHH